jgi:hypothetical protein
MDMEVHEHTRAPRNWREFWQIMLQVIIASAGGVIVSMIALFVIALTYRHGSKTFWFLGKHFGRRGAEIVLVLFVCAIGWLAHEFKQRQQGWYGLTEIVFGVASAVNVALGMVPGASAMTQWVALFGCTYIVVRGISNVSEVVRGNKSVIAKDSSTPSVNR